MSVERNVIIISWDGDGSRMQIIIRGGAHGLWAEEKQ